MFRKTTLLFLALAVLAIAYADVAKSSGSTISTAARPPLTTPIAVAIEQSVTEADAVGSTIGSSSSFLHYGLGASLVVLAAL